MKIERVIYNGSVDGRYAYIDDERADYLDHPDAYDPPLFVSGGTSEVDVREGQHKRVDSRHITRNGVVKGVAELVGDGKLEQPLLDELREKTGNGGLISDIRDPRVGDLVRGETEGYLIREGDAVFQNRARLKTTVLSSRDQETSWGTPYQSIKIAEVERLTGVVTPAFVRAHEGWLDGEQVQVTLNGHGAYDVQNVTAMFDKRSGQLIEGSVREELLHSRFPLPS